MEELMQKLTEMLNTPGKAEQIKKLAGNLISNETESQEKNESVGSSISLPDISSGEISSIMRLLPLLKKDESDNTTALLYALKPHLKSDRQEKIDKAIKLLKIYRLLPYIKESGLF